MTADISILIAIIGCFVGLAGWLTRRDTKISDDAEWKGTVNTKLDNICSGMSGVREDMAEIKSAQKEENKRLENHETRITVLEKDRTERKEHTA